MSANKEKHTIHWFRKGLRLHDNPALRSGIKNATTLRCIFIIDPWFAGSSNVGMNKWRFLLQCLEDLDRSLRKLNSRLFVIRGQPADALPKLFREWGTTCLTFEEDPEPYGKKRDQNVTEMCKELGIEVILSVSHTLYKLETIIEKNNAQVPLTYNKFQSIIATMDPPIQAEPAINLEILGSTYTPISKDHDEKYNVPTLDELGFDTLNLKPSVWIGGETTALTRLERHLERKAWVASFGRPKMTPQSLLATQTGLSPYLRFGCLSTRLFYHQLTNLFIKIKKTMPPLSLHGQLLWREFFYCAATRNSNFDKMEGNQICVQIPWDKNPEILAKWSNGQTGFPWIDAIMTQLREEGWIHHLARHAVACFLTRGDLWISWEEGMKVFEELLLDADWSNNAGMWMWLSCSSFFQQFFHCYCPVRFGRKADPNGDYIRKYLPVLKNFPTKYIHEPWNAPESVQRSVKCIVGKDYPVPMVNHAVASRVNMERMKQVYKHLIKYRPPTEEKDNSPKGISVPTLQTEVPYAILSPSPTTVIANTNYSGQYLCQETKRSFSNSTIISSEYHCNQQQEQQLLLQRQQQQMLSNQNQTKQNNEQNQFNNFCDDNRFYMKGSMTLASTSNDNTQKMHQKHQEDIMCNNMQTLQSDYNETYKNSVNRMKVLNENFEYNRTKIMEQENDSNSNKQMNNSILIQYNDIELQDYVSNEYSSCPINENDGNVNNEHYKQQNHSKQNNNNSTTINSNEKRQTY